MALIKCTHCGKDYSDLLSVCKHCNNRKELKWKKDFMKDVPQSKNKSLKSEVLKVLIGISIPCFILFIVVPSADTNYSECECVDFFKTHINSVYDISNSRTSEILECIETYVYNEKDGIKNINPCFDKAWKNVKQGAAFDRSFDVGFSFAVDAKDCNCN